MPTPREESNRLLLRARDAIDRSWRDELDVPALAAIACMSEAHFTRSFKATFGETPHRYLQRRRIERAMELLRTTTRDVTEVCMTVGFASLGTFSRTFTSITGTTPSAYRQKTPGPRPRPGAELLREGLDEADERRVTVPGLCHDGGMTTASMPRRRFTVAEYRTMIEAGVLHEDEHLELLHGEIVTMTPIDPPHESIVSRMLSVLHRRLGAEAHLGAAAPIRLATSVPQPDALVARLRDDFYRTEHPTPDDLILVVEIADSSLRFDRTVKLPLYAASGIAEAWLVDVAAHTLEVHTVPVDGRYTAVRVLRVGDTVALLAFPEVELEVLDLLGPEPDATPGS